MKVDKKCHNQNKLRYKGVFKLFPKLKERHNKHLTFSGRNILFSINLIFSKLKLYPLICIFVLNNRV